MLARMTSNPDSWIYGNYADPTRRDFVGLKASWIARCLAVRPSLCVLDYGCGEGKHLSLVRQIAPDAALVGVDIRPLHHKPDFEFHRLEPREPIGFADNSFDIVISCDVLEHVDSIERSLDDIRRVLRPHGALIGFVPIEGGFSPHAFFRMFSRNIYRDTKDHNRYYTNREVQQLLGTRFQIVRLEYSYHFLGGLIDAAFFASFKLPHVGNKLEQFWHGANNPFYQQSNHDSSPSLLTRLAILGNIIPYYESRMLRNVSVGACGLHFHVVKSEYD
jgi:SAM-dependent methyltransferase